MLIYKSNYLYVTLIDIKYFLHFLWTKPADLLDEVAIYGEVKKFSETRRKYRGRSILWDFSVIENRVSEDFYKWILDVILPEVVSVKAKRLAFLFKNKIPETLQNIDTVNINNKQIEFRIFTDNKEAMEWTLENADSKEFGTPKHKH